MKYSSAKAEHNPNMGLWMQQSHCFSPDILAGDIKGQVQG